MQTIAQQLKQFTLYLTVERNVSQHTVTSYLADIRGFVEFARLQGVSEALFSHINPIIIRAYLNNLKATGFAPNTIARRMASLKSYCRFLARDGIIGENLFADIHVPKAEKVPPSVLEYDEILQILKLPGSDVLGLRDAAILELLYATGIRVSELTGLAVSDVKLINRYILIYGEGTKERIVPVGKKAANAIEKYIGRSRPILYSKNVSLPHDKLFVNKNGGSLSDRSVRRIIAKYVDCLAVSKNINPQAIRHTFASHLIKNGADTKSVQELLGHKNFANYLFDLDKPKEGLKSVYQHAHPRA